MHRRLHIAGCLLVCLLVASRRVNSPITVEDGSTLEENQVTTRVDEQEGEPSE